MRAVILSINLEKSRISFGLKPSYFTGDDYKMHDAESSSHTSQDDHASVVDAGHSDVVSESEDDVEACLMFSLFGL